MSPESRTLEVSIEPGLAEEAVFREVSRCEECGEATLAVAYREELDRILDTTSPGGAREDGVRALHREWFDRLGLSAILETVVSELHDPDERVDAMFVQRALRSRDEGADLQGDTAGKRRPTLLVRVRPESFGRREELTQHLRRDLLHVADMVDPSFGYERDLPDDLQGPTRSLVRDRYAAMWALSVASRMAHRWSYAEPSARPLLERVFANAEEDHVAAVEAALADGGRPSHEALIAYARADG